MKQLARPNQCAATLANAALETALRASTVRLAAPPRAIAHLGGLGQEMAESRRAAECTTTDWREGALWTEWITEAAGFLIALGREIGVISRLDLKIEITAPASGGLRFRVRPTGSSDDAAGERPQ